MSDENQKQSCARAGVSRPSAGVDEHLLRITNACNQRCVFCNTADMSFSMGVREVFDECYELDREKTPVLTGGEPAVHPDFIKMLHVLREMGFGNVGVQTNGMLFADERHAADAAAAGLGYAVVSLHAAGAGLSDELTGCVGGFARTIEGIDNLIRNGIIVVINHVLVTANMAQAVEFVEFVHERIYGPVGGGVLSLSFVQPDGDAARNADVVPRISEAARYFTDAMKRCDELGIYAVNGGCGIPVCLTPGFEDRSSEADLIEKGFTDTRTVWANRELKVKGVQCGGCDYDSRCLGVMRCYAERFGLDELRPVRGGMRG